MMAQRRGDAVRVEHHSNARHLFPVGNGIGGRPNRQLFLRAKRDHLGARTKFLNKWRFGLRAKGAKATLWEKQKAGALGEIVRNRG